MILDKDLNGKTLAELIVYLLQDPDAISQMERTSKSLGNPEATKKIIELMMGLLKKKIEFKTEKSSSGQRCKRSNGNDRKPSNPQALEPSNPV